MTRGRELGAVVVGALAGAWLARAVFDWALDLPTAWVIGLAVAAAVVGAIVAVAGVREDAAP